ncbi:9230_t:CDS:2 [Rhizophagus irregularis]|nr:9230_t:CDS:2 [Rhizophagus irregularis]
MSKLFKELLQELYIILLNAEVEEICDSKKDKLNEFINNFLFEYDLDPKNVFEIITSNSQNIYYYSSLVGFFYQNDIILFRKDNYKLHKRNAENGDPVSQYYIANKNFIRAIYLVAKYYRDGNGTDKNLIEASKWFSKYELSKIYGCKLITLNNFLEGLDINAFEIETYKHLP